MRDAGATRRVPDDAERRLRILRELVSMWTSEHEPGIEHAGSPVWRHRDPLADGVTYYASVDRSLGQTLNEPGALYRKRIEDGGLWLDTRGPDGAWVDRSWALFAPVLTRADPLIQEVTAQQAGDAG